MTILTFRGEQFDVLIAPVKKYASGTRFGKWSSTLARMLEAYLKTVEAQEKLGEILEV